MQKHRKDISEVREDMSMYCLDFTTTQEIMGVRKVVELAEGGADIEMANDNFPEYLEAY
jgi:hypothetical protein